jgi:hypothetical protein
MEYIKSTDNQADLLTENLPTETFIRLPYGDFEGRLSHRYKISLNCVRIFFRSNGDNLFWHAVNGFAIILLDFVFKFTLTR